MYKRFQAVLRFSTTVLGTIVILIRLFRNDGASLEYIEAMITCIWLFIINIPIRE